VINHRIKETFFLLKAVDFDEATPHSPFGELSSFSIRKEGLKGAFDAHFQTVTTLLPRGK
jgi:hypothetical protein